MKIAIAATERSEDAETSAQAARAPFYLIYETPDRVADAIANPFAEVERSMGIRMADFLASKGVGLVVASQFGDSFAEALEAKGLRYKALKGSVRQAARDAYRAISA